MLQSWPDVFVSASQNLVQGFFEFIPGFLGAIIIFAVGWVLAVMVSRAIEHILNLIKIDSLFKEIGTERVLERMGFKLRVGRFIGEVVRWFIVIAFLIPSLEVLGLSSINDFLRNDVLGYLPKHLRCSSCTDHRFLHFRRTSQIYRGFSEWFLDFLIGN
jgi:hypothetical protein